MSGKFKKNGFYIAIAVCLLAVGVAAWSTYDAVDDFVNSENLPSAVLKNASSKPEYDVSKKGNYQDDGEAAMRDAESSSKSAVRETAGEVERRSPSSKPIPESEQSKPAEPVEAEPERETQEHVATLYEISSILLYPIENGEISKEYSSGKPMYSETMRDWRIHNGTDFKAENGTAVRACANGRVTDVFQDSMLGNVLVIEHGEYEFRYCGLGESIGVAKGDNVSAGQEIGKVSAVPFEVSDGEHFHLEVKRDGVYINPIDVLTKDGE
jgi:Membrane proteins related to metalloendopeptidases